jgi:membrane-bound lytic murein transglycosylase B
MGLRSRSLLLYGVAAISALSVLIIPLTFVEAQTSEDVAERRKQLERELERVEAEIREQSVVLDAKRTERVSLERDVAILDAEIKRAQLSIRARDLEIAKLNEQIGGKEQTIGSLNEKLEREKESLGQLLRRTQEIDDYSLAEVVLSSRELSDFFEDLDTFSQIKEGLQVSFVEIAATKADTQTEKEVLEDKKVQENELRQLQVLEKQKIEAAEQEKQQISTVTKGQEAAYQSIVLAKEKTAAQIRTELFALRDSAAIPFERALEYANEASQATGVRPAFLLGILTQETRLGEYIGTGNWRSDMHPTRDQPIFEQLMSELGLNPDSMPVSAKPSYGWGGAMGPAQFIPSTWILYKDRIAEASGQRPPNPWDARTAFIASALLLADNGASRGGEAAERLAAQRYFAGWANASKPAYAFYGDGVMGLTAQYQHQIDILSNS